MNTPASPHFTTVDLKAAFNCDRTELPTAMESVGLIRKQFGPTQYRGIPFALGSAAETNVILLESERGPITIDLEGAHASYLIFLHAVEFPPPRSLDGIGEFEVWEDDTGAHVSDYVLEYEGGATVACPILRRFAIHVNRHGWGRSGFACVAAADDPVTRSNQEDVALGRVPTFFGLGEQRTRSGRDHTLRDGGAGAWLYALPNPHPDRPVQSLCLVPQATRSVIYGLTHTTLTDHPLRGSARQKLLLTLPPGVEFNAIDEIDHLDIDLGPVISARRQLTYDPAQWNLDASDVQPGTSTDTVIVEYAAHPAGRLYLDTPQGLQTYTLQSLRPDIAPIAAAHRPVTVHVIDKTTRHPVGVRIHFHGEAGEYLHPKGYHRKVNAEWFEDHYAEFRNKANQYVYIRGQCTIDLPIGKVYIEITRGCEVTPVREVFEVHPDTDAITFELERIIDWRGRGWVTADTHVHFLPPTTAVLEGEAEDINVVNVLASQWGEMSSNVGDFDGGTTHTNTQPGNNGSLMCRVGSENRMPTLGHISLLGYTGELIHPLSSGGRLSLPSVISRK
ncbi:MAG: hypothetical protein HQ523_13160 [Lentisphaerae bacterium]|nr:hypothetical protein [Lentisphaerota bacterium]